MSRSVWYFVLLCFLLAAALISFPTVECEDVATPSEVGESGVPPTPEEAEADFDEEVEETEEEQAQMYVIPSPDITATVYFPAYPEGSKFVAGDIITTLIGLSNSGDKTFNVSYVGAHLHSPFDYSYYVQNFSVISYHQLVPPHSEVTFEYKFRPDEKLEPMEFLFSGWVIYNDTAEVPIIYRNFWTNSTIEMLEKRSEWSAQSVFTYTLVFAALGLVAYVFTNGSQPKASKKRSTEAAVAKTSEAWAANVYKPSDKQRAVGTKARKASNKDKN